MKYDRFEYQGKVYGIGTEVLVKTQWFGPQKVTFIGWQSKCGFMGEEYCTRHYPDPEKIIIKILKPVEIKENNKPQSQGNVSNENVEITGVAKIIIAILFHRTHPQHTEEVFYGWIFYIVVMLVGAIFVDKVLIWISATIIFFLWRLKK